MRAIAKALTARWLAPLQQLRRERGLAPIGHPLFEGQFSPYGTLALFSRVLGEPQPDWPARTTVTGFLFRDDQDAMPPELDAFPVQRAGADRLHAGSSAVGVPGAFYDESVKAAAALGRRAVLLVGRPQQTIAPRVLPTRMIAVAYAPHGALFPAPRPSFITGASAHGAGTSRGCPALVVPHAHDQFDNAARVERLGLGRTLDARRYSADAAAAALARAGRCSAGRRRGREIAAAIAGEDGGAAAVRAIRSRSGGSRLMEFVREMTVPLPRSQVFAFFAEAATSSASRRRS
jgi:UDP:flavonoid glycosyltransferase YjiC (YdhE family)